MPNIVWSAGEVSENAAFQPGLYATDFINMTLNDQKQPVIRASNRYEANLLQFTDTFRRVHYSPGLGLLLFAFEREIAGARRLVLQAYEVATRTFRTPVLVTPPITRPAIFFTEVSSETLTTQQNPNGGGKAIILVAGLTTAVYYGADNVVRPFKVFALSAWVEVTGLIDSGVFSSKLLLAAVSPRLTTDGPLNAEPRLLMSVDNKVDVFTVSAGFDSAQDIILLMEGGESALAVSTKKSVVLVTSSFGGRIVESSDSTNARLRLPNISAYLVAFAESLPERMITFGGFLILATRQTLRARLYGTVVGGGERQETDVDLPLLTSFSSAVQTVSMQTDSRTVNVFLESGSVKALHTQSMYPSHSFGMSLPITTAYANSALRVVAVTEQGGYIISVDDVTRTLFIGKTATDAGLLNELVRPWVVLVTVASISSTNPRVVELSFAGSGVPSPDFVQGMWLNINPDGLPVFSYFARLVDGSYTFGTDAAIDMTALVGRSLGGVPEVWAGLPDVLPEGYGYSATYSLAVTFTPQGATAPSDTLFLRAPEALRFEQLDKSATYVGDIAATIAHSSAEASTSWAVETDAEANTSPLRYTLVGKAGIEAYVDVEVNGKEHTFRVRGDTSACSFSHEETTGLSKQKISFHSSGFKPLPFDSLKLLFIRYVKLT